MPSENAGSTRAKAPQSLNAFGFISITTPVSPHKSQYCPEPLNAMLMKPFTYGHKYMEGSCKTKCEIAEEILYTFCVISRNASMDPLPHSGSDTLNVQNVFCLSDESLIREISRIREVNLGVYSRSHPSDAEMSHKERMGVSRHPLHFSVS